MRLAEPALSIQPQQLFSKLAGESHVALAVSGGSDSVAMMRLVHEWAGEFSPATKLTVLTVDHGLRPEAAAEAARVATWCAELSIHHETLHWTGEKPLTGIQAKARAARYDLMTAWCAANDMRVLLTAHTRNDQAETVLMRQQRTDTAESLAGIWETTVWKGIEIFRPLLGVKRSELRDYLRQIGQTWIDDPSNLDVKYERVRVRGELGQDDGRMRELADIASAAGRQSRGLADAAREWNLQHLDSHPEGFGIVPRREIAKLDADVQQRALQQLIHLYGSGNRVDPHELSALSRWIAGTSLSRRTLGGAVLAARKNAIVIGREAGRISTVPSLVPETGEMVWDDRFLVKAQSGSQVVRLADLKNMLRRADLPNFVQQALPAILTGENRVSVPHLKSEIGVSAKFIRYLR